MEETHFKRKLYFHKIREGLKAINTNKDLNKEKLFLSSSHSHKDKEA